MVIRGKIAMTTTYIDKENTMKNLFIDANIWLSLYHFTSDDLEQFGKLKSLIGTDLFRVRYLMKYIEIEKLKLKMLLTSLKNSIWSSPLFARIMRNISRFMKNTKN